MVVDVLVVVVTYNAAAHLPALLTGLPGAMDDAGSWRLVIADNASADATCALAAELAPGATLVQLGRNAGFAAGINAAVAAGGPSRAVLVLNPDLILRDRVVARLQEALAAQGVGMAVPRLLEVDGRLARSQRRTPTVRRALGEALLGGSMAGRIDALGEVVIEPRRYEAPASPDWATGAALLVDRRCYDELGGFDESFFLYSEETDFALRARDAGWSIQFEPAAEVVHVGGDSNVDPRLYALLTVNRARLFRRRHGPLRAFAFRAALATGEVLRLRRGPTHRAALRALVLGAPTR